MKLKDDLCRHAWSAGGSTQTRNARVSTIRSYVNFCKNNNIQTSRARDIKSHHIKKYIDSLRSRNSDRTLQNKISHLRTAISHADGRKMPTNEELGIAGAPRTAARTALTDENYHRARAILAERGSLGERACLRLQKTLGLRAEEAFQAAKSLKSWEKQLKISNRVHIVHGTKGGKPRFVYFDDPKAARDAIAEAKSVLKNGKLIQKSSLSATSARYDRECDIAGLRGKQAPHSARYAWTQERIAAYERAGYETREALSATSLDLGHGDGRGRWIKQIYSK